MNAGLLMTRQTLAWAALIAVTLISWMAGHADEGRSFGGAIVLALAFGKTLIVIREFMEVRHAPRWLRLVTAGWIAGACLLLVMLYVTAR